MDYERYCAICGTRFMSQFANAKFHSDECRRQGKLKTERERMAGRIGREYELAKTALEEIRTAAPIPAPHEAAARKPDRRFFKSSLADTPETPAGMRDRDYQLTGAAAACNHGAGIGLIGVGI